jgi:hypothetical protein
MVYETIALPLSYVGEGRSFYRNGDELASPPRSAKYTEHLDQLAPEHAWIARPHPRRLRGEQRENDRVQEVVPVPRRMVTRIHERPGRSASLGAVGRSIRVDSLVANYRILITKPLLYH